MPITRVSLRRGKSAAYRQAILTGLYEAMQETFNVPETDYFMLVTQHDAEDFWCSPVYLASPPRSDDLVIIQLTVNNTRNLAQKQALYRRISEKLGANPGIRPENVFINLLETTVENWSLGHGLATLLPTEAA